MCLPPVTPYNTHPDSRLKYDCNPIQKGRLWLWWLRPPWGRTNKASSNTGYGLSWRAGCVSEFGLLRLPFWLKFGFSNSLFVVVVFVAMAPPPQPPADRGAGPPIPRRRPRRPCSCIPPAPPSYPPTSPRRPDPRPNTLVVSVYTQALASDRSTRA